MKVTKVTKEYQSEAMKVRLGPRDPQVRLGLPELSWVVRTLTSSETRAMQAPRHNILPQ